MNDNEHVPTPEEVEAILAVRNMLVERGLSGESAANVLLSALANIIAVEGGPPDDIRLTPDQEDAARRRLAAKAGQMLMAYTHDLLAQKRALMSGVRQ